MYQRVIRTIDKNRGGTWKGGEHDNSEQSGHERAHREEDISVKISRQEEGTKSQATPEGTGPGRGNNTFNRNGLPEFQNSEDASVTAVMRVRSQGLAGPGGV